MAAGETEVNNIQFRPKLTREPERDPTHKSMLHSSNHTLPIPKHMIVPYWAGLGNPKP